MSLIHVPLPKNLIEAHKNLFEPLASYVPYTEEIEALMNVNVIKSGIVGKNFRINLHSIPWYKSFRKHFYKIYLYNIIARKKYKLKNDVRYAVIHNPWCPGYFHWLTEALPRLELLSSTHKEAFTLLFPETLRLVAESTLAPYHIKNIEYFPDNSFAECQHLLLPYNTTYTGLYNPATILKVRNRYWQYYQDTQPVTGRKVYISRAKASRRKVANEQEVIALLKQFGYETHCMEDLTFTDQVKLMMQSSHLVSIHGAGLTNMLFMQEGSQILELYLDPYRYNKIPFSKSYFRLAGILNHNYYYLFSDPVGNNNTIYDADIVINLDNLKKYLDEVNT